MQYFFLILATAASYTTAQTVENYTPTSSTTSPSGSPIGAVIPIGQQCKPGEGEVPCALGADCYAVNSMLIPVCGNFQASCTSDQQCAFNKCNAGFCNGPLLSSSSVATPPATTSSVCPAPGSTDSQGRYSCNPAHQYPEGQQCILVDGCYFLSSTLPSSSATPPEPTAPAGTLPLGAECKQDSECSGGAQCWASNSGLIRRCGNFNAACKDNSQCAYNTCNNGLCNGQLPSGSYNGTSTVAPTGVYPTSKPTDGYNPPMFTGAASPFGLGKVNGLVAALLAVVGWVV